MNCRKTQKLIPCYLALEGSWLNVEDRSALEAHLAGCNSCRQASEESRELVHFLQKHWQISEDTQAWLDKANFKQQGQKSVKVFYPSPGVMKVASVAAAILVGMGITCFFLTNNVERNQELTQQISTQSQSAVLQITENGVPVSVSGPITTKNSQLRKLLINNKHRLVVNKNTSLFIEPVVSDGKLGCLVNLRSGQIFAHVEHDGNPFEVHSPHGMAVITGTTFDVKVADHETVLVVAEGSVRFGAGKGMVQVSGGYRSSLKAHSQPTEPVACNTNTLMDWASRNETLPAVVDSEVDKLLKELPLSYPRDHIDLESLDYDKWVEEKRPWFKGQFPWIFDLQETLVTSHHSLATETIPSYVELLINSGDLWQIVYPHHFYRQIPVIQNDSLSRVVDKYQLDSTRLDHIVSQTKGMVVPAVPVFFGLDALNQWFTQAKEIVRQCDNADKLTELCEYSMTIGEYLENTRTLTWLCIHNGTLSSRADQRESSLNLLKEEVSLACQVRQTAWQLSQMKNLLEEGQILRLISLIEKMQELEMQINHTRVTVN